MGCNCGKNKAQNATVVGTTASRSAVYQVLDAQGQLLGEHSTPQEARIAAVAAGGRVRITSRAGSGV
jgi:hypothetical protein